MSRQHASVLPLALLREKYPSSGPCGWRAGRWTFMQTEELLGMEYEQGTDAFKVAMEEMEENGLRKAIQFQDLRISREFWEIESFFN